MAAKKELVQVRVLVGFPLEGTNYTPGQLVGFPAALAEQLEKSGAVDTSKDALEACKAAGFKLIEHSPAAQGTDGEE